MLDNDMDFVLLLWLTIFYAVVPTAVTLRSSEFCYSVYLLVLCVAYYCHSKHRIIETAVTKPWSPAVVTAVTSNDCGSF
jgi:hypothetical protein